MTPSTILGVVLAFVPGYLLGSLNFAVIVSRLYAHDDVRRHGSGNAGMTNMLRTYGKFPALLTALGDIFKGTASVWIGRLAFALLGISFMDGGYLGGIAALLGHLFPLYFGFKGGKGVLVSAGALLAINPLNLLVLAVIFVPFVFLVKIVSLTSILAAICYPIVTYLTAKFLHWGGDPLADAGMALIFSVVVIYMHRDNIKRLLNGTESRFGQKKHS